MKTGEKQVQNLKFFLSQVKLFCIILDYNNLIQNDSSKTSNFNSKRFDKKKATNRFKQNSQLCNTFRKTANQNYE